MKMQILIMGLLGLTACQGPSTYTTTTPTYTQPRAYYAPVRQKHVKPVQAQPDDFPFVHSRPVVKAKKEQQQTFVQPSPEPAQPEPAQAESVQPEPAKPEPPRPWSKMEDRFITTHDPDMSVEELKRPIDSVQDRLKQLDKR